MGAVRHLSLEQAVAALRRGRPVEQLLESAPHDPEAALEAARAHGAAADRWVNSGMVGDEYGDARGWM